MDRTKELKRILKPGMNVKLKETTEDWDFTAAPITRSREEALGCWGEIRDIRSKTFVAEDGFIYPISMIEKVEGEELQAAEVRSSDTIPVPREKVKAALKGDRYDDPEFLMKCIMDPELIDTLLEEIEEEEKKYVTDIQGELYADKSKDPSIAHPDEEGKSLIVANGYVPEIFKQDGKFIVKFKKEE